MSDIIQTILDLKRKDEVIKHVNDNPERCDECDCDNVWDLEFDLFRCHLEEHRDCTCQLII